MHPAVAIKLHSCLILHTSGHKTLVYQPSCMEAFHMLMPMTGRTSTTTTTFDMNNISLASTQYSSCLMCFAGSLVHLPGMLGDCAYS